jgi:hypothetical protein
MRVAVVLARFMMQVLFFEWRELLQPFVSVLDQPSLVVVHINAGCYMHGRYQSHAIGHAARVNNLLYLCCGKASHTQMTPHADAYLVLSFFPAMAKKRNTFLFAPMLRQEVLSATPKTGDYALVYVTSRAKELPALLKQVRCRFIAYGFGIEGQEGNILFKKPSMNSFLRDLTGAKAVIANAGFSLVSEALYLGKPYLAVPVKNQFEQTFNAYYVDKLGYGAWWEHLGKEQIESFLFNLPVYSDNLSSYLRAGNAAILAKVDELIGTLTAQGCDDRS